MTDRTGPTISATSSFDWLWGCGRSPSIPRQSERHAACVCDPARVRSSYVPTSSYFARSLLEPAQGPLTILGRTWIVPLTGFVAPSRRRHVGGPLFSLAARACRRVRLLDG